MATEAAPYDHVSVVGLPTSLLQPEGNTTTVVAMMQKRAGLNRERRRELKDRFKDPELPPDFMGGKLSKADRGVLPFFLNPGHRFGSFWFVVAMMAKRRIPTGTDAYAAAVDVQLLNAYEPKWLKQPLDEDTLIASCQEWPRIREHLEESWSDPNSKMPLGMFMLWPKLLADLGRWDELDLQQRLRVGHVVFALSSISRTKWFVDDALRRCPGLGPEFAELRRIDDQEASDEGVSPRGEPGTDESISLDPADAADPGSPTLDLTSKWSDIGDELTRLQAQWGSPPSRALAVRLATLGKEADELLAKMPDDVVPPRELLKQGLETLRLRLLEAINNGSLDWLGSDDLDGITARWHLALADAADDDVLTELVQDAMQALDRIAAAIGEAETAKQLVYEARQTVTQLDEQLTKQISAIRRIELSKRRQQAKEDELAAERKQTDVMLFVLASASPRGEAFDPEANYPAQLLALGGPAQAQDAFAMAPALVTADQPSEDATPVANEQAEASAPSDVSPAEVEPTQVSTRPIDAVTSEPLQNLVELESISAELSLEVAVQGTDAVAPPSEVSASPAQSAQALSASSFTDAAGVECRPIWALLRHGRPALAYQYGQALQEASPQLRVPPLPLLRVTALVQGLVNGDGPLALSIGEVFAEIEPVWFKSGDTPSNWHTAVNLLLIAATLRPMVLAPGTGAASIARYRHLDGRHEALLQLVRKVSDVSEPMIGLPIGPTVLRSAADETSQRAQLKGLSRNAEEWLNVRAPSKKIRFAPASKVWFHWLKSGEMIHRLISPVARGAIDERAAVKNSIDELSRYDYFIERLQETDRRHLGRRGQDIEAGALEHLWVATGEAVAIAKGWLAAADLLSDSFGRLRSLVGQLQAAFDAHAALACEELSIDWDDDDWGLIDSASRVLRAEVRAIADMFKQSDAVPVAEPLPNEMLTRDLLLVPAVAVGSGWVIETNGADLLSALKAWANAPVDFAGAFEARVQAGDLAGAEMLLPHVSGDGDGRGLAQTIERARDLWVKDLQRLVQQARRASEVGLAYGYLSDTDRAASESELSAVELGQLETTRFDAASRRVQTVVDRIEAQKSMRVAEAQREFERERPGLASDVAQQVEAPLARSDIHTFHELLQRVRQGLEPWPERDRRRDVFREFYPKFATELQGQLLKLTPEVVDKTIRSGGSIGHLSFHMDGDEQLRAEAEHSYNIWATAASKKVLSRDGLRKILEALGVPVRGIEQDRTGKDSWLLETTPIDDRDICPVPHFGSRAVGRYRVVVLKERPEDLLQSVGDNTQHTATIVVSLVNIRASFLADLARMSKERHRSFLLLDQAMLLFLLAQRASRLATWFGIALPFTYSEPYDASAGFVPGEMFYGRATELESVKAQGGCYFIYGGRQLGKTALLRRAERTFHDPSSDRYAVWLDTLAQGIGERRPAADVWLAVSEKLRELRILGLDLPPVNPAKATSVDAFVSAIKSFLAAKHGRRILLLLDEADHFFEHDARQDSPYAETRRLKQLMDETERRFKVVFAGLHNVLRTASTSNQPLGHLNEAVRIGPLMDEREIRAAEELITRPIEAAGFEFDDRSLVMRVLAQTNYYPSLIQLYCTQVLRHLRETKLRRQGVPGPRFRINEADIESVFSGRPLRDAIRSKFRLTLQLDDRYEVIANALGLEALASGFDHTEGIDWRRLWEDCKTTWWPEGFAKTTERDFLILLEEMVQLGVLSPARTSDRFSLRNPNVLLLLGSKQEIEDTLQAEREPRIEFVSTIFRPTLGGRVDDAERNPLTYRQLDEVMQMRSSVLLVAASEAAGAAHLIAGLRDQPGMSGSRNGFVALDRSSDKIAFTQELDREVKNRVAEGITVMLVPANVTWDVEWVAAARAKLNALTSRTKFVSVVFCADPKRLWELVAAAPSGEPWVEPWLSVLPWDRGFVRKWLEELQFPPDSVEPLKSLTGYWGGLLASAARVKGGALDFAANLDRLTKLVSEPDWRSETLCRLTGGIEEAERVLATMATLGDGVTEIELVDVGELPQELVERVLRWAEPLGIVIRHTGAGWTIDPFVKRILEGVRK